MQHSKVTISQHNEVKFWKKIEHFTSDRTKYIYKVYENWYSY